MIQLKKIFKNKLFQHTLIYGITNALYSGLPLLLLPFLVVVLEPEDYGLVDLFRSISMVLVPMLGFSAVQSIGRFYFDLEESLFKKFVSSIQLFQLGMALLALVVILLISPWLSITYQTLFLLCIAHFFFGQFIESILVVYRVKEKPKSYLVVRVFHITLELALLFLLYKSLTQLDWTFRVYPTVIASMVTAILVMYQYYKIGYKIYFSKALLGKALIYSSPLILHMISGYILNIGDRFFIKYFLDEKALGNYAVAYQIGMAVNFFYTSFNLAWTPTYFKWMKEKKYAQIKKIKKLVYTALPVLGAFVLGLWSVFRSFLLTDSSYTISNHIVVVVLLANTIFSLYKFNANYFLFIKNTKRLSIFTVLSAIISVICNIALIPRIGILGSAYSTLLSFIALFIFVSYGKNSLKFKK